MESQTYGRNDRLPPLPPGAHYEVAEVKRNRVRVRVVWPELRECQAAKKLKRVEPED